MELYQGDVLVGTLAEETLAVNLWKNTCVQFPAGLDRLMSYSIKFIATKATSYSGNIGIDNVALQEACPRKYKASTLLFNMLKPIVLH